MEFIVSLYVFAITLTQVIARPADTDHLTNNGIDDNADDFEAFKLRLPTAVRNNTQIIIDGTLNLSHKNDQQRRTDDPYRLHTNGSTNTKNPLSIGNNMFSTPTALRVGSEIRIIGQMNEDRRLQLDIETNDGIVCQIVVANRPNEIDEENFVKIIGPGNQDVYTSKANTWFNNGTQYAFRFEMNDGYVDVYAGIEEENNDQFLESVEIDVNKFKTISVNGEVEKLIYTFKQRE